MNPLPLVVSAGSFPVAFPESDIHLQLFIDSATSSVCQPNLPAAFDAPDAFSPAHPPEQQALVSTSPRPVSMTAALSADLLGVCNVCRFTRPLCCTWWPTHSVCWLHLLLLWWCPLAFAWCTCCLLPWDSVRWRPLVVSPCLLGACLFASSTCYLRW